MLLCLPARQYVVTVSCSTSNNKVYVIGGYSGTAALATNYIVTM